MDETSVKKLVWARLSGRSYLFRVNTGRGWVPGGGKVRRLPNGDVVVPHARPVALGLGLMSGDPLEGTSDLIGWTPVVITGQMVGLTIPAFTGIEVKETGGGRLSNSQAQFIAAIRAHGGFGAVVSSPEEADSAYLHYFSQLAPKLI